MARTRTECGQRSLNRMAPESLRFRIALCGIKGVIPLVELTDRISDASNSNWTCRLR
ncbi:hypothetical protein RB12312 [Rhodopirellula baltica SH 1]|uniref:Uncharacterized protein n=1 Tax=Rhodopirellula baltica (strain DSM 10527 / NCIMB 13988 / SH1) TaxID=243090 RepID=Q7UIV3_RHOBA|nr:hypothetical protein RB12312 [Rhodopirellula baltica SH 1]